MKNLLLVSLALALTFTSCRESNAPSDEVIKLSLTGVDGKPLPFSVGIIGTAQTMVTGGTLTGSNQGPICALVLTVLPGAPVSISILPCTINKGDVIDYPIDLGNNTGVHNYRFE
jgi:hypothetical protein